jgi:protein JBTS26
MNYLGLTGIEVFD